MPHRRLFRAAPPPRPPTRPAGATDGGEGAWFARPLDAAAPGEPSAGEPDLAYGELGLFKLTDGRRADAARRRRR